jgi:hypothetical protein
MRRHAGIGAVSVIVPVVVNMMRSTSTLTDEQPKGK